MALTQKQRDAMPDEHFALPDTKQLPINDEKHVKLAWDMVDNTKDLSDAQRKTARQNILKRAKELGVDTQSWDKTKMQADDESENDEMEKELEEHELRILEQHEGRVNAGAVVIAFSALAMSIPDKLANHPNQTPFSGVLTRIDQPSDNPLSGSNGKRVIIPKDVAEAALPSLLGMGVDMTDDLSGHDPQAKIGVITDASIEGNEIVIKGYFYGADFPTEIKRIQAEKSKLGFSYECQAVLRSPNDDPLVMKKCVFTGAAVLYKDKAAYTSTSLSASKKQLSNSTEINMTTKEKDSNAENADKAGNPTQVEALLKKVDAMAAKIETLEANAKEKTESDKLAAGSVAHLITPHANALRACADKMEAAGVGAAPKSGHAAVLNHMAGCMEADAAQGRIPSVYQGYDFLHGSADKKESKAGDNEQMKKLQDSVESLTSQVTDLTKREFHASGAPARQTVMVEPAVMKMLAKSGIKDATDKDRKLTLGEVNEMFDKLGTPTAKRIETKFNLQAAGKLVE